MTPIDLMFYCAVNEPFKISVVVVPELPASVKSVKVIVFVALSMLTPVICVAPSKPVQLLKLNTGVCTPELTLTA